MYSNYNMKIAKNNYAKKMLKVNPVNGHIPITIEAIHSVPCTQITNNKALNELIRSEHMHILELARTRKDGYRHDEVGFLFELVEPYKSSDPFWGRYDKQKGVSTIPVLKNLDYHKFINEHSTGQLLFLHNHPNNSELSFGDIASLITTNQIRGITAVCNNGHVYCAVKNENFNKNYKCLLEKIMKIENGKIDDTMGRYKEKNKFIQELKRKDYGISFRSTPPNIRKEIQ